MAWSNADSSAVHIQDHTAEEIGGSRTSDAARAKLPKTIEKQLQAD
jgi:hypothetical protein